MCPVEESASYNPDDLNLMAASPRALHYFFSCADLSMWRLDPFLVLIGTFCFPLFPVSVAMAALFLQQPRAKTPMMPCSGRADSRRSRIYQACLHSQGKHQEKKINSPPCPPPCRIRKIHSSNPHPFL